MFRFITAYIKSMRLYLSFVPGVTGWIGLAFYESFARTNPDFHGSGPLGWKKILLLAILFFSWGLGQIINDYMGIEEDRINAPKRPMVSGELTPFPALFFTGACILSAIGLTWVFLSPFSLIFLALILALTLIYEFAKAHGYIGNLVYGISMAAFIPFALTAVGGHHDALFSTSLISLVILSAIMHTNMCFFSYFKDVEGDKAAGKQTLIVRFGTKKARIIGMYFCIMPLFFFILLRSSGMLSLDMNPTFIVLGLLSMFLQIWTGIRIYRFPEGIESFRAIRTSTQACACSQAALIAFFDTRLALWLFLAAYIFTGFLFEEFETETK